MKVGYRRRFHPTRCITTSLVNEPTRRWATWRSLLFIAPVGCWLAGRPADLWQRRACCLLRRDPAKTAALATLRPAFARARTHTHAPHYPFCFTGTRFVFLPFLVLVSATRAAAYKALASLPPPAGRHLVTARAIGASPVKVFYNRRRAFSFNHLANFWHRRVGLAGGQVSLGPGARRWKK